MTEWNTCKLSDVVGLISGFAYKSGDWQDSGVPVLKITNVRNGRVALEGCSYISKELADESEKFQVKKGDLLITLTGEIGATGFYSEDFEARLNQRVGKLISKNKGDVDLKFVAYFLESPQAREIMWATAKGIAQANISPKEVLSLDFPLPPIEEQHKILEHLEDHLSRLEAALVDLSQARTKAAQFRRSLLQTTFTGNLGSDGAIPFTEWQRKTVGEIADTQLGKMLNKGKQSGNYAKPYLRTDNVHWGKFDLSEIKEMDILPEEHDKYLAIKGDLLMCEGGASGRTAIWNEDYDISFQNHVHRIRPKNPEEILPKYLLYYFEWFIKNGHASDLIKGVTISSLSQSGLRSIAVVFPPIDQQHRIIEILEGHLSRLETSVSLADVMEKQSNGLRRSILQAAFTGQLTKEVVSV
jgi:type I restriction enzyme S subunit